MSTKSGLKSGTCSSCNSQEIYVLPGTQLALNARGLVAISTLKRFALDIYVCTACGRLEEYMSTQDLENATILEKIKEKWKKV